MYSVLSWQCMYGFYQISSRVIPLPKMLSSEDSKVFNILIDTFLTFNLIGDVANSKLPLLSIAKVQLRLRILPAEVGQSLLRVKILWLRRHSCIYTVNNRGHLELATSTIKISLQFCFNVIKEAAFSVNWRFKVGVLNRQPAGQIRPADHSWLALCQLWNT